MLVCLTVSKIGDRFLSGLRASIQQLAILPVYILFHNTLVAKPYGGAGRWPMRGAMLVMSLSCLASFPGLVHATHAVEAVPQKSFPRAQQPQVAVGPSGTVYLVFG